jgi:hypothetical protein
MGARGGVGGGSGERNYEKRTRFCCWGALPSFFSSLGSKNQSIVRETKITL